jgi:hypothetical protein
MGEKRIPPTIGAIDRFLDVRWFGVRRVMLVTIAAMLLGLAIDEYWPPVGRVILAVPAILFLAYLFIRSLVLGLRGALSLWTTAVMLTGTAVAIGGFAAVMLRGIYDAGVFFFAAILIWFAVMFLLSRIVGARTAAQEGH